MPIGIQNNEHGGKDPFETFLDDLKEPREVIQETVEIPEPVSEKADLLTDNEPEPDPVLEKKKAEVAMIPAEVLVDVIDTTAVSLNSYIALEQVEGASETEKQSMQKAIANYLRETDIDISPGKLCLVLIALIYGPKVVHAFQVRKQNLEFKKIRGKIKFIDDEQTKDKEEVNEVPTM